jgi:hypothetical protein
MEAESPILSDAERSQTDSVLEPSLELSRFHVVVMNVVVPLDVERWVHETEVNIPVFLVFLVGYAVNVENSVESHGFSSRKGLD